MSFARSLWNLLVGIKDALVLLFMIGFFALLYAALKGAPDPVHEGILHVDLDGVVVEEAAEIDPFNALVAGDRMGEWQRRDLVAALREAAGDPRIKAVALDLDGFLGGGQVALGDVASALDEVRAKGKTVTAFATGYSDDAYQLAVHADEIWLDPMGAVAFTGPGGNDLYFAGLMDRLGITANLYRAGGNDYKSAVEPYTRSDMSPEARRNAEELAGTMFEHWLDGVEKARPAADVRGWAKDPEGWVARAKDGDLARAALDAKIVDKVAPRRDWHAMLAELAGTSDTNPDGYKVVALDDYVAHARAQHRDGRIGVVTVAGSIVDGSAPSGTAAGTSIADAIDEAVDDGIDALVVRVDSPGGSALASERIRQALVRAREKEVKVLASFGNVAASGGYWVALGADEIYAEPASVTGSIGVFGIFPSFEGTLAKLGVGVDGVKTTPLSGEPDLLGGPSDAADALIQAGVEHTYARFLALAAAQRKMDVGAVRTLAGGRVYDGGTARQLGLVDGYKDFDEVVARAAELLEIDADRATREVRWIERPSQYPGFLTDLLASGESARAPSAYAFLAGGRDHRVAAALAEVETMLSGPSIQARCLACPRSVQPATAPSPGWRGLLRALLD